MSRQLKIDIVRRYRLKNDFIITFNDFSRYKAYLILRFYACASRGFSVLFRNASVCLKTAFFHHFLLF